MPALAVPKGFRLSVASAGFKTPGRKDTALLVSDSPAVSAGLFTKNLFKAAPVLVGMEATKNKTTARAVLINTAQANAATGEQGLSNCRETLRLVGQAAGIDPSDILPGSTGVIGVQLKMDLWQEVVPALVAGLGTASMENVATAIMTTDAFPKYAGETVQLSGGAVVLAGVAKGAGMICPNMATMLSAVICDAAVDVRAWRAAFNRATEATFNRASVDGDTSTNDTLYGLANGASGVTVESEADLRLLEEALTRILAELAYKLVQDGEGASKVMHIRVRGSASIKEAEQAARTVGHSQLVKTAMYGKDANWGRIVAALGRSGVDFDPNSVGVTLSGVELFRNGQPLSVDVDAVLKEPLERRDIFIDIVLGSGAGEYTLLASDLTHEYVNINADYRS